MGSLLEVLPRGSGRAVCCPRSSASSVYFNGIERSRDVMLKEGPSVPSQL